jgi:hypothetical protein
MWETNPDMAIVTIHGIPVYSALVTDADTGILRISLVDDPAVESNFIAFDAARKVQLYAVQDEEKRLVLGVVMRADFPIYRRDERVGEYYVLYSADTCRKMAEKYLADGRQNEVNTMHREGSDVEGVNMVQWFIKGEGINPAGFEDIADGSLFAQFHVENDDVWAAIKEGTYKGFSLEGVFDLVPETDKNEVQEIVDALGGVFSRIANKFKSKSMSKLSKFKAALAKALAEFGSVTTDGGVLVWDGDDDLKAGDAVFIEDAEGNRTPAEDKDYRTDDAKVIRVVDGKVAEIVDDEAEVAEDDVQEAYGRKDTDKGAILWEGEEDLKAGDAVFVEGEDGNEQAPDGDYKTEDGKVIVVENGIVVEIKDAEAEVAPEDLARRRKQKCEESYDEKYRAIAAAVAAVRKDEFYIAEAGDDFAVVCAWDEDYVDHFYRYEVSWNEDGSANVANPVEVKSMFVPIDFVSPFEKGAEAEIREQNSRLQKQVRTLEARIEKLSKEPAARPAHEEAQAGEVKATGNKGLDKLARYLRAK